MAFTARLSSAAWGKAGGGAPGKAPPSPVRAIVSGNDPRTHRHVMSASDTGHREHNRH